MEKVKLLLVDDSEFIIKFVRDLLADVEEVEIVGHVKDGKDVFDFVVSKDVDVILMDIEMPEKNGAEATREIMAKIPRPIIIFSSFSEDEVRNKFRLFDMGALEYIQKKNFFNLKDFEREDFKKVLVKKVLTVSKINVIRHIHQWERDDMVNFFVKRNIKIIGVGASTGGPRTLQKIFSGLKKDFQIPFLVVQHISDGFLEDFINTLSVTTKRFIKIAENGEKIKKGKIYFIPNGFQPVLKEDKIYLDRFAPDVDGFKPSANVLFSEMSRVYQEKCMGLLLTGMGTDGAKGLLEIKRSGGITIAQDEESCVVFGMPKKAIEINAATFIFSVEKIINFLNNINK